MAHVFYNFPLTLRIVGDAWSSLNHEPHRASKSLGAGPLRTFLMIDLPRLVPSILTAAMLTFIYCFMSFAIILVLGGGPELSTLEVEVYRLVKYNLDFSTGSALALVESVFLLVLMGLYSLLNRRSARDLQDAGGSQRPAGRPDRKTAAGITAYLLPALLLILAPLVAVVVNSFFVRTSRTGDLGVSIMNWVRLFEMEVPQPAPPGLRWFEVWRWGFPLLSSPQ